MYISLFRKFLIVLFLGFYCTIFEAQVPIGQWREHYPYFKSLFTQSSEQKTYCATPKVLLIYNKSDHDLRRISTINGLSDVEISAMVYDTDNEQLIIGYKSGNIDFIDRFDRVYNLPSLKNSSIIGSKEIKQITFQNGLAYVSSGIGVVVLNTQKREIKDTYLYGPMGTQIATVSVALHNGYIYAATELQGVFRAPLSAPNLADFNNWSKIPDLPNVNYSHLFTYAGNLYANVQDPDYWKADSIFVFNGSNWQISPFLAGEKNYSFRNSGNKLVVSHRDIVRIYNENLQEIDFFYTFSGILPQPNDAVLDNNQYLWVADRNKGFIKIDPNKNAEVLTPNGPLGENNFSLSSKKGKVWMLPGAWTISLGGMFRIEGIHLFEKNEWKTYSRESSAALDSVYDLVRAAIDPSNTNKTYFSSWGRGLIEWENDKEIMVYNNINSTLKPRPEYYWIGVGDIKFDKKNNLWITNAHVNECLQLKTSNNQWKSFNLFPYCNSAKGFVHLVVDDNNQKWLFNQRGNEILVVDDKATYDDVSDDNIKLLTKSEGNLPAGEEIYCAEIDNDGKIWVGTDQGVYVFFSPGSVFNGNNDKGQQIYITQDGIVQLLLETEAVTAIAVDGGNRKWFGTAKSGVFLMSENGTELIEHFTRENSPLPSNAIISITINDATGEVFFSTDKGLIAYMGTATEAKQDCKDLIAFPNPVKDDYTGLIAIRGLIGNSEVKITDTAGNLVYKTTSFGGQAVWDGKGPNGEKVATGVYIAHCAAPDGSKSCPVKILIAAQQ